MRNISDNDLPTCFQLETRALLEEVRGKKDKKIRGGEKGG
jgi:hypothetical protein